MFTVETAKFKFKHTKLGNKLETAQSQFITVKFCCCLLDK